MFFTWIKSGYFKNWSLKASQNHSFVASLLLGEDLEEIKSNVSRKTELLFHFFIGIDGSMKNL